MPTSASATLAAANSASLNAVSGATGGNARGMSMSAMQGGSQATRGGQAGTGAASASGPNSRMRDRIRCKTHDRLVEMGLVPIGRATDFADDIFGLMARTPLFSSLDMQETHILGGFMQVYEVPSGVTLINEGDAGDFMLLLMSGMVDVLRRNRYNYPSRIAVAHAGHALGEMSMFDGEPRFASCMTLEQCRIAILSREALMTVLRDQPALGNKILLKLVQLLSERLRQTSAKLVSYLEASREG